MLDNETTARITALGRRHSAARPDGTLPAVYFRIDGGKKRTKVAKVMARLDPAPNVEDTTAELLRRAKDAAAEHRFIAVRAMSVGDSSPIETVRFEGEPDIIEEEEEDNPKGPHSAAEALARVALGQMRLIDQMNNRLEQLHNETAESDVKAQLYKYHSMALQQGAHDGMVARVAEQAIPQLFSALPEILRIAAAVHQGAPVPPPAPAAPAADAVPDDPADAIGHHVNRVIAHAQAIAAVGQQHANDADVAQRAAPHFARLRALVVQVAALLGLQVVQPGQAPPPPAQPADPADDPEAK